jgi:hypothetical protein
MALEESIDEKLTWENYLPRKVQVLPAIHDAHLLGYLDGTILAPIKKIPRGTPTT